MATFGRVAPAFHVRDIHKAIGFWTKVLGFEVAFTNGEPICFAIVRRDQAEVHLGVRPGAAGNCHCHLAVDAIDELHRACEAAGVTIRQPPKVQSWGVRDMIIADPDGNTMEIGEPAAEPAAT